MVKYINNLLNRFFSMPNMLWLLFTAGLLLPAVALGSVLSGMVVPTGTFLANYGATKNWIDLTLAVSENIPTLVFHAIVFMKRIFALIIFPFAYLSTCTSPFLLSMVKKF